MRKKNYKGVKCTKRYVEKCEGVCKTFDNIQYVYADLLSMSEDVQSFKVNVLLEGLQEGEYTSDFVITKADGDLMVRDFYKGSRSNVSMSFIRQKYGSVVVNNAEPEEKNRRLQQC